MEQGESHHHDNGLIITIVFIIAFFFFIIIVMDDDDDDDDGSSRHDAFGGSRERRLGRGHALVATRRLAKRRPSNENGANTKHYQAAAAMDGRDAFRHNPGRIAAAIDNNNHKQQQRREQRQEATVDSAGGDDDAATRSIAAVHIVINDAIDAA